MLWGVASLAVNSLVKGTVCQMRRSGMLRDSKAQTSSTVMASSPATAAARMIQPKIRLTPLINNYPHSLFCRLTLLDNRGCRLLPLAF